MNTSETDALTPAGNLLRENLVTLITGLLNDPYLETLLTDDKKFAETVHARVYECLHQAYHLNNPVARHEIQSVLFKIYNCCFSSPISACARNQYSPFIISLRNIIETGWLASETRRTGEYALPPAEDNFISRLTALCRTHRAATHPLFDYLSTQAGDRQFDYFFRSDTALNVLFFDLVAMMLPGSYPFTRGEITKNLWDEAGQGNEHHNHVDLYHSLLKARDLCPGEDQFASLYNWQGLTGYNVFLLGGVNRQHYFKLVGAMAMTELLDPPQYSKLVAGARRIGISDKHIYYYSEHIEIDVDHADGWLNKVIQPLIDFEPASRNEIYTGALLRLETCADYYDDLLNTLKKL
ncbi:iron-containing redox enzyme family protein [Pluralibacter gergoviae]|mgnify:CR=1 FL=1|uniref:iron-containing redox enzyme family protein n=1 Tax=Enterobacterales TaxID=91347 RepID=UPI000D35BA99|nr:MULTISPECIES: iron-containing redox enzyme family protein [Enterobacterales]EKV9911084.1 iron-containing redox enzyme family protein [Pluralibacter gergoviae]HBX4000036.1 iron-containing redox enzyme family protein [Klebsiella variicola]ELD4334510.1 iron-containing redox enzyme family protein [Pluralibacter gergoviae]MBZ6861462.1 iron-containing redox enzyme family protein [Klebsiella michiganensis]MBZ7422463.1 iron-containing redox enzyme family protein [Klebsiella michiganensis]